jgi:tetratricopeptide (TPR) repeat protein
MRWISVLALLFLLIGSARASGPDDQYLDIYNQILQADNLQQNGHLKEAAAKYLEAQKGLTLLKQTHPTWNTEVVSFRLEYLSEQLQALAKAAPATPAPAPPTAAPAKPVSETANLQEQIRSLTAANAALENKLKEALSVQPAAVSPLELAKAGEKIIALQKEKDLLSVALEQAKAVKPPAAPSPEAEKTAAQLADANQALASFKARSAKEAKSAQAETEQLKASLADAQKKIAADDVQLETLKSAQASAASASTIAAERDKLKETLAARTRDLADAEAHRDQYVVDLRAKLAGVERQRDELQTKLAAVPVAAPVPAAPDPQVERLSARLAVLEAQAVPYTPEELAALKKNPSSLPAQALAPPAEIKHVIHSKKDLPPGAGPLMEEASDAIKQGDFAKAEQLLLEILHQDENNVFVLGNLAHVQFVMGKLAECDKTVARALAADPEDPASLMWLGMLRYRQEKLDEALNALSLSVKYASTNAAIGGKAQTQYYLGRALAEKGLRAAAETAFRKALEADPLYADAHYSLAFLYAVEKPPSPALARWHYQRAVDLGHGKSQEMEKLLAPSP